MKIGDKVKVVVCHGTWAMVHTEKGLVGISGNALVGDRDWVVVAIGDDFPTEEDSTCPAENKNNIAVYDGRIVVYTRVEYLKPVDDILQGSLKEEAYKKGRECFKREALEVLRLNVFEWCGCDVCKTRREAISKIEGIK